MKSAEYGVALMLGGNLGDSGRYFNEALLLLTEQAGKIEKLSAIYLSEPWGMDTQPAFKNQAVILRTGLTAHELLRITKNIEVQLGRIRREINGPREIDIDILLFDDLMISEPDLEIPHPRLHLRNFNLIPLAEIASGWMHPVLNQSIAFLRENCTDPLQVQKLI